MEERSHEVGFVAAADTPSRNEDAIDSATLARLLDEVRNGDEVTSPTAYNRLHNRHNRS